MSWRSEHGEDYAVPSAIVRMGGIVDLSWHNDVCPRFCVTEDGSGPNLWVDHPDPERREYGPDRQRFLVTVQVGETESSDDFVAHEGDDMQAAIAAFVDAAHAWASRN